MKKLLCLVSLFAFIFASCQTFQTMNDYDATTFEKIEVNDSEKLGRVSVSSLAFTWELTSEESRVTKKLMRKLEDAAVKKYGKNIDLRDVEIGGMNKVITLPLWTVGTVAGLGLIGTAESTRTINPQTGKEEEQLTNLGATSVFAGLCCMCVFFVKSVKATATVVKSDSLFQKGKNIIVAESDIERKKIEYLRNKREQEEKEKILKMEMEFARLKNQLVIRAQELKSPIAILLSTTEAPNSASGVNYNLSFINATDKLIKYVYVDVIPYNRVFDITNSSIDGVSQKTVQVTDFIAPNEIYSTSWGNVWYNSTIAYAKIQKIKVIFIDNTSMTIDDPAKIGKAMLTSEEKSEFASYGYKWY